MPKDDLVGPIIATHCYELRIKSNLKELASVSVPNLISKINKILT